MRIVGGIYKRRRFDVPKNFKARPTTDFAKENLFNVVSNLIDLEDTEALDLFSGTGSIAFELLSRGCKEVVSVEKDPAHYAFIKKVKEELKDDNITTIRGDVFKYLDTCNRQFDFIFADPPYALKNLADIPQKIIEAGLIAEGGIFVMEHPKEYDFSQLPFFSQRRVYGAVNFSIFER
ncbi:RsmD family RNA methyltransferase [Bacteroidales bacterium OttesenSCG-928-I14]|nr:RsmD family RNA methyltransferase [Bacteroidales bacterium OttesenSCG-928-I14]